MKEIPLIWKIRFFGIIIPNGGEIAVNSGSASAHYSLFDPAESQGVINGTENISGDPLFVDQDGLDGILGTSDDDFQLQASSPAINIGSNGFTDYPSHDILGKVDRVSLIWEPTSSGSTLPPRSSPEAR